MKIKNFAKYLLKKRKGVRRVKSLIQQKKNLLRLNYIFLIRQRAHMNFNRKKNKKIN